MEEFNERGRCVTEFLRVTDRDFGFGCVPPKDCEPADDQALI